MQIYNRYLTECYNWWSQWIAWWFWKCGMCLWNYHHINCVIFLALLKGTSIGNHIDPSTTRALDFCKKYILYPYNVLLIVVSTLSMWYGCQNKINDIICQSLWIIIFRLVGEESGLNMIIFLGIKSFITMHIRFLFSWCWHSAAFVK